MSNNLLTISMISMESLRILSNVLGFAKYVNRQYDNTFANTGAKIGSVINIRKPVRYVPTTGPALQLQDINDQYCGLTLSTQAHVDFQFNSKDMTLSVDAFADRYLKTAINALANKVDYDGLTQVNTNVAQAVGTPGTTPNTALVVLQANQKLSEAAAPFDGMRYLAVNPAAEASIVDALKGLFQKGDSIASQYEKALMGVGLGFNWTVDQNIQSHTVGAWVGSGQSNGANQTGSSIVTSGWTGSVTNLLLAGDIITFAGVYACNPVSFGSTGALKQFVVTSNVTSSSGAATIPVFPSVVASGPYCNIVSSAGGNGSLSGIPTSSAITVLGAANAVTPNNIAYHRDAFVLGMADLDMPGGVEMAARAKDNQVGMALRVVRAYDIVNDQHPCRLDILYGWQSVYPELACRLQG
jgi:hypothetical protein